MKQQRFKSIETIGNTRYYLILVFLFLTLFYLQSAQAENVPPISQKDKVLIKEAFHLLEHTGDAVWKGWANITLPVNFVDEQFEYLVNHPSPSDDFVLIEEDPYLKMKVYGRPRKTRRAIAAAYPVCGIPSVLLSSQKILECSSPTWVITLIHEMFHVYQQNNGQFEKVRRLKLGSDTDAMWMLNYPFPYSDVSVRASAAQMYLSLFRCLQEKEDGEFSFNAYLDSRKTFKSLLQAKYGTDNNYKYATFQEWIEGAARYTEKAVLEKAVETSYIPLSEFTALEDYTPFADILKKRTADPPKKMKDFYDDIKKNFNRVSFYETGALQAEILDIFLKNWKSEYFTHDIWLDDLLDGAYKKMTSIVGKPAPLFALKKQNGETVALEDFIGKKPVLLFFLSAASWAKPTYLMLPAVNGLSDNFKEYDLAVLGILFMSRDPDIENFATKQNVSFPLLLGMAEDHFTLHEDLAGYRISHVPGVVLIDRDGTVVFFSESYMDKENLYEAIKTHLKKQG
ncbi:MAG: redoxin domain-containing protein [Candidatus Aminicenantes bacterium]|nr:redoxin domain-containing protein [Candidatus Aminicenantes bacterium]